MKAGKKKIYLEKKLIIALLNISGFSLWAFILTFFKNLSQYLWLIHLQEARLRAELSAEQWWAHHNQSCVNIFFSANILQLQDGKFSDKLFSPQHFWCFFGLLFTLKIRWTSVLHIKHYFLLRKRFRYYPIRGRRSVYRPVNSSKKIKIQK